MHVRPFRFVFVFFLFSAAPSENTEASSFYELSSLFLLLLLPLFSLRFVTMQFLVTTAFFIALVTSVLTTAVLIRVC